MSDFPFWPAPSGRRFKATVALPGSKSLTNRELVLSALAGSPTKLIAPLRSRDSELMIQALSQLGTAISWQGSHLLIEPKPLQGPAKIDCGLAGTVMRFVPPLALIAQGEIEFDGDEGARRRPMHTTIDSLRALGAQVKSDTGALPFTVTGGTATGGELQIDASASSQFVSGLLLMAARLEKGLVLHHVGEHLPSMPHIEMTLETLRARCVDAKQIAEASWQVKPGEIVGGEIVIEPDLSNAGPFLAAAMVTGGEITIPHWPAKTTQVGAEFERILPMMGAKVSNSSAGLTLSGTGEINGIDIDLSIGGELAPVIAALAALADSPSRITGIAHLRGHETDRLSALSAEINRLGGDCRELPDGLEINPKALTGGHWLSYEDHRMATAGAIIGLRVEGVEVENIATTSKTMPDFPQLWSKMLESN
jgi:3-phosphoshikimate 1-carboxyvinyltransferase